ncbi:hypothetical protein A2118_01825 [Candidatus Kaiserbacteria bacterium GWA2_50_9]|uniref:CARDB domain-containing protein n=1 Tax=Candidatus Kaiserbacteria bacterium GWA2_50_9 TaxID=1798474 RepID=A0A1F6BSF5_9BACT|nr:MAG: hypothetical protein A2118_01825 [Candidatus Kaiserbacteria bacterium GWA2_50_9]
MNETIHTAETRKAATRGLAIVGFIALVGAGIWLAVYSTRYVPIVVNNVGVAAVYLGSIFTPAPGPTLSVVPNASTTIPFGEISSTTPTTESPASKPVAQKPVATTAGEKTTSTVQIGSETAVNTLSGLPDFVTTISAVGYLTTASADSFVASSTVPTGSRAAVSFSIKNVGANASGPWCFSATIPTHSSYLYQSQPQQSLNPGDSIDYTLGFDQAYRGADQMISVTANIANTANTATCARTVTESNTNNNSASAKLTILGG